MRVSPLFIGTLSALLLSFTACGPVEEDDDDATLCGDAENCVYEDGEARCADGFDWVDDDDAANFDCADLCTSENFCARDGDDVACVDGYEWGPDGAEGFVCVPLPSVAVLGGGGHTLNDVLIDDIANRDDGLNQPRDLEFHPDRENELWLMNHGDNSTIVITDAGTDDAMARRYYSFGSDHFLAKPSAMAFGEDGLWASAQETDRETQGPVSQGGTPADFMGPTLWPSDLSYFDAGHSSHFDMLHNSPNAVGMAWETGNKYWVYDGYHGSITSYDFADDHGPGGAQHSDGIIRRCVDQQMGYFPGVSSHMVFDHATGILYAVDTANNLVVSLDTNTGVEGGNISPNYDCWNDGTCSSMRFVDDAVMETVVDGDQVDGMFKPSGLELHDNMLFVSDNGTGRIFAFDLDGGLVDYLDTEVPDGSLQGMAFDAQGRLLVVNTSGDRVMRIAPLPAE